jgi:hypothetical protein
MEPTSHAIPAAEWVEIAFLRIFKEGDASTRPRAYVFSNTRQQCMVKVEFLALDAAGKAAHLTEADIARHVSLIQYAGGQQLGTGSSSQWRYGQSHGGYVWLESLVKNLEPTAVDVPDDAPAPAKQPRESGTQVATFYVSTGAAETQRVAVEITRSSGASIAKSNWSGVAEGDGYGDGNGKFNASVDLFGVRFRQPPAAAYGRKRDGDPHLLKDYLVVGTPAKGRRSYEQFIELDYAGVRFHWRYAERADTRSRDICVWNDVGETSNGTEWSITYVIQPNERTYRYFSDYLGFLIRGQSPFLESSIWTLMGTYAPPRSPSTDWVVIGQVMGDDHYQIHDWNRVRRAEARSRNLVLMDEFGNEHFIRLYLPEGNYFNFVAIDTYREPAQTLEIKPRFALNRIALTLQQTRLYANGRQQVRVGVTVEAKEGSEYVALTEAEKASIRLFDYDTREEIPLADAGAMPPNVAWAMQPQWAGYQYFPAVMASMPAAGETVFRYVTAGRAALAGPVRLGFSMLARDGTNYRSNGWVSPADGTADWYAESLDIGFDITVTPVAPDRYAEASFLLARRPLMSSARAGIFADVVTLEIVERAGQTLGIRDVSCDPVGMAHWQTNIPGDTNPCLLGYARPGETAVHWHPAIFEAAQPLPNLRSAEVDRAAFVLCGRVDLPASRLDDAPRGPLEVNLVDAYGSEQRCSLFFKAGTRDELLVGG